MGGDMKNGLFIAVGMVLLLGVGLGAACKSSDTATKNRVSGLETQVAQSNTASAQSADMASVLTALASAQIHEFTTSVDAGTLPAGESDGIQRALAAVAAVQWPSELKSQADDLKSKLTALLNVLGTDDINQIKGPADAAHELNDSFPGAVYGYLATQLHLPTPVGSSGGTTTPGAGSTPGSSSATPTAVH
jgi:hypothetical protein